MSAGAVAEVKEGIRGINGNGKNTMKEKFFLNVCHFSEFPLSWNFPIFFCTKWQFHLGLCYPEGAFVQKGAWQNNEIDRSTLRAPQLGVCVEELRVGNF